MLPLILWIKNQIVDLFTGSMIRSDVKENFSAIHLCLKYPNQVLYVTGKASDVKYGVSQFICQ